MKITSTLIFAFLLVQFASAQPALNSITVPSFGSTFSAKSQTDNTVDPGAAGNQTWDYSAITFTGASSTSTIVNPANTTYGAYFPTATIAEESPSGDIAYYDATTTHQIMLGARQTANSATVVYNNPMTIIQFPIAYNGASQTDNFASSYTVSGIPISTSGTVTTEYDGYGTIKTENGTFTNVARLKSIKDETVVVDYGGGMTSTSNYYSTTYSWVVAGSYTPVFAIMDIVVTSDLAPDQATKSVILYPSAISANKDSYVPDLKITVGPNPATEKISVDFTDVEAGNYELTLVNNKGIVISNESIYAAPGDVHELNIRNLNRGLYLVKISSDKGESIKKIIKN